MKTSHSRPIFHILILISLLLSLVAGAVSVTPASALTLTVINTDDSGAGSLRQALLDANNGDVIDATGITGTITLASQLVVADDVTINGPGAASLTVSGNNAVRVFNINTDRIMTINDLTIANGYVLDNDGGGILNDGALTLNHVVISNNTVATTGLPFFERGGGIYTNTGKSLTVMNSTISGNHAVLGGGGINMTGNSTLHLENVIIDDNHLDYSAGSGGGISISSGVTTTLDKVTITNNTSGSGGGLYSESSMSLTNSLMANNSSVTTSQNGGDGGGISFSGAGQIATLTNVTISGNSAGNANNNGRGGGIVHWEGTLNLTNVTIAGNTAQSTGGGFHAEMGGGAVVNMRNTILSGNTASASPSDCFGNTINSLGYNLIKDVTCTISGDTTGNLTFVDPQLGVLADNGGPTKTMALLAGSPAINAGTNTGCPATDQRGVTRPFGATCDMGAYEVNEGVTTYRSAAAQDGWVLESAETSGVGGTKNNKATTLNLGDDIANKQYRSILSFNTTGIPASAVITKVTLKVKRSGVVGGGNPINTFKGLLVDIKKGNFGTVSLALDDFKAAASKTYGPFKPALSSGWYSIDLTSGKDYVNKTGATQVRLRFKLDDNNNYIANYLKLYSGNAGAANRPQLIIQYYVP